MSSEEFTNKVKNTEIENGTKFNVYLNDNKDDLLGVIGVIDTTVVFLDMPNVPMDLYTSETYYFETI